MLNIELNYQNYWFKREHEESTFNVIFDLPTFKEFAHYFKQLGLKGIYVNDTDMYDCDYRTYYDFSHNCEFDNYVFAKFIKNKEPQNRNLYIEFNERFGSFTIKSNRVVNLI